MSQLIESIKILNGKIHHLSLHEARANHSRKILFGSKSSISLRPYINIPQDFRSGLVKCRIIYTDKIEDIKFEKYSIKEIKSLKVIYCDEVTFDHKYLERPQLDSLYDLKGNEDEIMIVKNGMITDAYYYNLVFKKVDQYFTPSSPLLEGTMRSNLISKNRIITVPIPLIEMINFESVYLINAMTKLGQIEVPISQIII
jgi:4-amino-4-deoxychorismate lyase